MSWSTRFPVTVALLTLVGCGVDPGAAGETTGGKSRAPADRSAGSDATVAARPTPWPLDLPPGVPTTGEEAWRATWQPAPDAEQSFLDAVDADPFPVGYLESDGESLVVIGYQVCTDYYHGTPEIAVYDKLADGAAGLPGPSPFELAQQAREITAAAGEHLCKNVRVPGGLAPALDPQAGSPADPVVRTGEGDAVVPVIKPGGAGSRVLATITGNEAGEQFTVRGADGENAVLVDTTGPYAGTVLLDGAAGGTTQLEVTATGPWSITLSDVGSAPTLRPGVNTGTGDQVFQYEKGALRGLLQVQSNATGQRFQVLAYGADDLDLLINTLQPYNGQVRVRPDSALVAVRAQGGWSISLR